jgi:hypothetical protein
MRIEVQVDSIITNIQGDEIMNYRELLLKMANGERILARRECWPCWLSIRSRKELGIWIEMYDRGLLCGTKHYLPTLQDQNAMDWEYIRESKEATP